MVEPQQTLVPIEEKIATVRDMLFSKGMQQQLRMALPKHVSAERLARLAMTAIRKTPKLLDCSRESLFGAIMEAGQLGLEIGTQGHAWLVPYGKEVTLLIGYRGMADLAWRSDKIRKFSARVVREGDLFSYAYGLDEDLVHVEADEQDQGEITHFYSTLHTTNGGKMFDVMTVSAVEALRDRSRSSKSGPWATDFDEMGKKCPFRRMLKLGPCSTELRRAITLDEQGELGMSEGLGEAIDITPDNEVPIAPNVPEGENE